MMGADPGIDIEDEDVMVCSQTVTALTLVRTGSPFMSFVRCVKPRYRFNVDTPSSAAADSISAENMYMNHLTLTLMMWCIMLFRH